MITRWMVGTALFLGLAACGPEGVSVENWAPADARALSEVVLEHVESDESGLGATFQEFGYVDDDPEQIRFLMRFDDPGTDFAFTIQAEVRPGAPDDDPCHYSGGCDIIEHDGMEVALSWWDENLEDDPGGFAVVRQSADEYVRLAYEGKYLVSDPREADMQEYFDLFFAIVSDPRFGVQTDADLTTDRGGAER